MWKMSMFYVLSLKKDQKQEKMCAWRPGFVFDFFQIQNIYFFMFGHIQKLA